MNSIERYFVFVIALLLALSLSACGGKESVSPADVESEAFDDLRTEVREAITAPEHQAEVLAIVDGLQADFKDLSAAIQVRRSKMRGLNADYDATREQFSDYLQRYDGEIKTSHERFRTRRRALIASTTPEEWSDIGKTTTKSMKTLAQLLQTI